MMNARIWRKSLIWILLCAVVISGGLSSVLLWQHSRTQAQGAGQTTHLFPVQRHKVSYTSAAYYSHLHSQHVTLLRPGSPKPAHTIHKETHKNPKPGRQPSQVMRPQPSYYYDSFYIDLSAQSPADATYGVAVQVCASSDDDGAAYGEIVYLAADSGGSFSPSDVTLD